MMNMRPKTVRRLVILLSTACLLIALGVGFVFFRLHQRDAALRALRDQGLTAYKQGDYASAMKDLGKYLSPARNQADAEALFAYAKSRSRIEEPNHKEISEAIFAFKRYLDLKPDDLEARHLLMDLYVKAGNSNEASDLADDILAKHPDDAEALRGKASALLNLRQYPEALKAAEKLNQINPTDLQGQLITLRTMAALDTPVGKMLKRTAELRAKHPNDPRFEMLEGFVHVYQASTLPSGSDQWAKSRADARQWLLKAAAHPVDDVEFVRQLSAQMDALRMYGDAQKLLETAARKTNDPKIKQLLVERLFQNNHFDQVLENLKDLDPEADNANSDLLAFKALALLNLNRQPEARKITQALARRTTDESAVAWAATIRTYAQQQTVDPHAAIETYRAALIRSPRNAVTRYLLGETYARVGENALALQQWARAADAAQGWYRPYFAASRVLLGEGRVSEALNSARMAYQCLPNNTATITNLLLCQYRAVDPGDAKANATLMSDVEKFLKAAPDYPAVLPIYAGLLGRAGKNTEATGVIRKAMGLQPPPSAATLIELAQISRTDHLGLEASLLDLCQKVHGLSPQLALARAALSSDQGKAREGLDQLKQEAEAHKDSTEWQLALARYMESIADPEARQKWMKLADDPANANKLEIQLAAMEAPSLWTEPGDAASTDAGNSDVRQFLKRTIDRVHELTSEDAIAWQLGYARWLLGSDNKQKDSAEAIVRLNDIVQAAPHMIRARLLLATALEQVGQNSGAVEQLQYAARANPTSEDIQVELARLLQAQGKSDQARDYLQRALQNPRTTPRQRFRIASMLASAGDTAPAVEVLQKLPAGATRDLMLADLYLRQGKTDEAAKIYQSFDLLNAKQPSPSAIQAAADFQARGGNVDLARRYLARLKETTLSPAEQDLILARFDEHYGTREQALGEYTRATQTAPTNPAAWRALAGYQLRQGQFDAAVAAADKGLQSVKNDEGLTALRSVATQAKTLPDLAAYQPLVTALSQDPQNEIAQSAWRIVHEAAGKKQSSSEVLSQLRDLANKHPRYLPLQSVVVSRYAAQGDAQAASDAVSRLMDLFPTSPEVAEQAVRVYTAAHDWQRMLVTARKWRQRSLRDPLRPDLAIAEAQCFLGNPAAALSQLNPYLDAAVKNPGKYANVLVDYTRALVLNKQDDRATQLLTPLLKQPFWRAHWLTLASLGARSVPQTEAWIQTVVPYINHKDSTEVTFLAKTWYDVAQLKGVTSGYQKAMDLLTPLARQPKVNAMTLVVLGSAAERAGKTDMATGAFRQLLKLDSASAQEKALAGNELAWMLLSGNGDINEARALSEKAVQLAPRQSAFQDTLGRIYLKQGNRAKAIEHLQEAVKLNSDNLDTLLTLGLTLYQDGKPQQAAGIVDQIDKLNATLSANQTKQLDDLRQKVRQFGGV